MTRRMYDSTNPHAIPRDAEMILWYNDGIYAWDPLEVAMFPNAVKVSCSAVGAAQADVYDVEPGCIWPIERVGPLVKRDWGQGLLPTVYLNRRNHWQAARDYFRRTYGREPQWHVAEYDGDPSIPDGAVAKQYAHPADPPGSAPSGPWELPFHADVSSVRDYWPGVDHHAPGGGGSEEEEMALSENAKAALEALVPGRAGERNPGETFALLAKIGEYVDEIKREFDFGETGVREAGEVSGFVAARFEQVEQSVADVAAKVDTLSSQLATLIEKLG